MAPSVGATGIRTRNLALFKDVVPPAFVTNSDCNMATRVDENSQPALRLVGRNSNPLVANVISPAFAIKFKEAARQSGARQFSELSPLRGTGKRTRASRLSPGALPCSPAGIPAASNSSQRSIPLSKAGRQVVAETEQFGCSLERHSARKNCFHPGPATSGLT